MVALFALQFWTSGDLTMHHSFQPLSQSHIPAPVATTQEVFPDDTYLELITDDPKMALETFFPEEASGDCPLELLVGPTDTVVGDWT